MAKKKAAKKVSATRAKVQRRAGPELRLHHPYTILVADDCPGQVKEIIELLQGSYDVVYVTDGRQALARLQDQEAKGIDGLLTDLKMGLGPDGDRVALEARAMFPGMPIILRSSMPQSYIRSIDFRRQEISYQEKDIDEDYGAILRYFQERIK